MSSSDASAVKRLEDKVAVLEDLVKRMTEQTVALGNVVLERAKRDDVRLAMVEVQRVMAPLIRASQFYPKTRTVVFVGRNYFGDNVKYAYLSFLKVAREKNIRTLFLAYDDPQHALLKAAGLPCLPPQVAQWTQDDAKALLGAAVAVICDNYHPHYGLSPIPYALLQGAKLVQLWHGIPIKEIGLQHLFSPGGHNVFLTEVLGSCGTFDVLVGPGKESESEWQRWFAFREYAPAGYPRNDAMFRDATEHERINVDNESLRTMQEARKDKKPVILYAPTFRDHIGPDWFEKSGIIPVIKQGRAQGMELIVNLHPFEQGATGELRIRYPELRFLEPNTDIYPLLRYVDVFMTDYSSLAFDILHTDCPQVFYRPDHEDYMRRARAIIPGREAYTPGDVVTDPAKLGNAIAAAVEAARNPEKDTFKPARHALRKKLFDHHDGNSGARVAEAIVRQVEAVEKEAAAAGRQMA